MSLLLSVNVISFFNPTALRYLKVDSLAYECSHTLLGFSCFVFLNRLLKGVCSKSGRPVSLAIMFADCGRCRFVFYLLINLSGALKCC